MDNSADVLPIQNACIEVNDNTVAEGQGSMISASQCGLSSVRIELSVVDIMTTKSHFWYSPIFGISKHATQFGWMQTAILTGFVELQQLQL
mgnify:CR=1 FL=1